MDNLARRPAPVKALRFIPFEELKLGTGCTYLVKGLIPRTGLVVVWGPPKCGKSFWVFDLMMHVALGWDYRGRRVQCGSVVYCAMEGAEGFNARAEAFRRSKFHEKDDGDEPVLLNLMPTPLTLVADHPALIAGIRRLQVDGYPPPAAVVIDTLNRSLSGSESKDEDMAAYVRAADAIRDAFGCVVIIVHHSGIDASRPRGHTSLTGAADAQISVKRDPSSNVVVEVEYMKDGPEGATFTSRLESVAVGADDDGEPITSCVVMPAEAASLPKKASTRKLTDNQRLALDALTEALLNNGRAPPPSLRLPGSVLNVVAVEHWRDQMHKRGVLDRDAANPRADFKRIRQALAARKLIGDLDGLVWHATAEP